jgi:DNA-directed RNA polymerase subunit RPC12/RpoP
MTAHVGHRAKWMSAVTAFHQKVFLEKVKGEETSCGLMCQECGTKIMANILARPDLPRRIKF